MSDSTPIPTLILGYGEMGHAMEALLATRHSLRIWQRRVSSFDLETAVEESEIVLFCLPATAHSGMVERVAPALPKDALCLTIAKGLDDQGRLPYEVLSATIGADRVAVLYGPMISEEIRSGKPAYAECGSRNSETHARVASLFAGSALQIEAARDITGLSWSAILKNVYAMAFGMADELSLGDNVRGLLSVAALHELSRIVKSLGGETPTPFRLAGLGDLITTATSTGSHHHDLGRQLARGVREGLAGEGLHTLAVLRAHPRFDTRALPLFRLIDGCTQQPGDIRTRLSAWLRSPFSSD